MLNDVTHLQSQSQVAETRLFIQVAWASDGTRVVVSVCASTEICTPEECVLQISLRGIDSNLPSGVYCDIIASKYDGRLRRSRVATQDA